MASLQQPSYQVRQDSREMNTPWPARFVQVRPVARDVQDPQAVAPTLSDVAVVLSELGLQQRAAATAGEAVAYVKTLPFWPPFAE